MKKVIWGASAALVLFISVIAVVMWNNFKTVRQEEDYVQEEEPQLPTMSFTVLGYDADMLVGYRKQEESVRMADALLPVETSGQVAVKIHAGDVLVDEAQAMLYSLDGTQLIEKVRLSLAGTKELAAVYQMTALAEQETEYLLTFQLHLADETECFYSVKICQYGEECFENKETLLGVAADFSDNACEKNQELIQSYVTYDRDRAGTDLHYVNQNTEISLITWAGLEVQKQNQYLNISEWSDAQISVVLCYEVNMSYGSEESSAAVKEAFCLRERDNSIFLLNYERYTSEYFGGNSDSVGNTSIPLGIQQPDTMDILYTDYGINIYFTVNGEVWHYNYNTNTLTCVFTFGRSSGDVRLDTDRYTLGLSGILDGILYFTVQGYMESGIHEGSCGMALYGYNIADGTCQEYLYAPWSGADTDGLLTTLSEEGLFYMNLGDGIYALDLTGSEILKLYSGVDTSSLQVNEDGTLAVWQYEGENQQLCLLDISEGTLRTVEADRTLIALGFIGDDLVYGREAAEQLSKEGFVYQHFMDQICIVARALQEKAVYAKDDVLISSADVTDTGVLLSRYMVENDFCTKIEDDILSLAVTEEQAGVVELKRASSEIKRNYYYINLGRTVTQGKAETQQARRLSAEAVTLADEEHLQEQTGYAAYAAGGCVGRTESLAQAIEAVYDRMGTVYNGSYLSETLWNRDARDLYLTMTLPTMTWTQEGHEEEMAAMSSLERGVDIFIYAGVNAGVVDRSLAQSSERDACETAYEELTLTFGDQLLNLTGSRIGYLLYYINLRHPVLCLTEEDTSLIITGYTSTDLMIYDPATRETTRMTQEDAQTYFDNLNTIFVSF